MLLIDFVHHITFVCQDFEEQLYRSFLKSRNLLLFNSKPCLTGCLPIDLILGKTRIKSYVSIVEKLHFTCKVHNRRTFSKATQPLNVPQ